MDLSNYSKQVVHIGICSKSLYSKLSPIAKSNIELQDIVQAGYIGLLGAIKKNSINDRVLCDTYLLIRIRGEMIDHIRKFCPISKNIIRDSGTLITKVDTDSIDREIYQSQDIDTDRMDLEDMINSLIGYRHRNIMKLYLEGFTYQQIGDMDGTGESNISQKINTIIKKLKKEHEYTSYTS